MLPKISEAEAHELQQCRTALSEEPRKTKGIKSRLFLRIRDCLSFKCTRVAFPIFPIPQISSIPHKSPCEDNQSRRDKTQGQLFSDNTCTSVSRELVKMQVSGPRLYMVWCWGDWVGGRRGWSPCFNQAANDSNTGGLASRNCFRGWITYLSPGLWNNYST